MSGGLFDIAEPGESTTREACPGRVVGIDLGTTNSLVATVREGTPICLAVDDQGGRLLPSVVEYRPDGVVVGAEAFADAALRPRDTIVSAKRFMGRGPDDLETRRRFVPYQFAAGDGQVVRFVVAGPAGDRPVTAVEVSAEILRQLRRRAEAELGGPLDGAVITVPAYFDDAQRQATKDAGRLAGLEVLRLLNEPTAAALAYGLDRRQEGTFAVYDLGGGTFDISILKLSAGIFEVKSTAGDTALGGDDFDRAIAELVVARLGLGALDPGAQRRLLDASRAAKHRLTDDEATTVAFGPGVLLQRSEVEAAIAPIVGRTATACRRALKDAGIDPLAPVLDGVILVGGATRVPAVRRFVAELFRRQPLADLDPDQVVALGAAVQADLLAGAGPRDDLLLLDVIPLSLGLEMMGGVVEKIIHRNSTIPTGARQTFTTYADRQTGFDLHIVQGERETVDQCRSLARFQLTGLPPLPAGMARLEVTFLVDADGILHVTAREETSGKNASIEVKPSYGLAEEEIERLLLESYTHAEEDLRRRALLTARVEAVRILQAARAALAADGHLLPPEGRAPIDAALATLDGVKDGADPRAIDAAIAALDHAALAFAQLRMDDSLHRAVAGQRVADVERRLE